MARPVLPVMLLMPVGLAAPGRPTPPATPAMITRDCTRPARPALHSHRPSGGSVPGETPFAPVAGRSERANLGPRGPESRGAVLHSPAHPWPTRDDAPMTDLLPPRAPPGAAPDPLTPLLPVLRAAAAGWLTPGRPATVAAAPGRLDVMGGIADYSGAVVLEGTIGHLAAVALQRREDGRWRVRTAGPETERLSRSELELPADVFFAPDGTPRSYEAVRAAFPAGAGWAAYVLGVFYVLVAEGELPAAAVAGGADVLLHSAVPLGAGVASSAAVEVAAMRAAVAAYGAGTSGLRLAALCQMVENRVVGAPCGIMDQVTCALGQAGRLLALRCQPRRRPGVARPAAGTDLRRAGLRGQARRRRAALRAGALRRVHGPAPGGGRLERRRGGPAAGALPLQRDPGRVPHALPRPAATAPLRAGVPRPLGRDGGRGDGRRPGRGLPGAGGDRAPDLRERPGAALHRPADRGRPGGRAGGLRGRLAA